METVASSIRAPASILNLSSSRSFTGLYGCYYGLRASFAPQGFFNDKRFYRKGYLRLLVASSSATTPTSLYAKEMERIAAKESLLLAIKDAGGDSVISASNVSDTARIDVNERIVGLERLNPTPRPTTSPLLEGLWQFKWIGAGSPGLFAAGILLQRFPASIATLSDLNISIFDQSAQVTVSVKLFNMITTTVVLTSKLSVEGPLRLKESYADADLNIPSIQEGAVPVPVPEQVQTFYDQISNTIRLPDAITSTLSNGIKIPLDGSFERQLLISYLDDEILVARDGSGIPEVLFRLPSEPAPDSLPMSEYVS